MAAQSLVGLHFVGVGVGPIGGLVLGHACHETLTVRVLSEAETLIRHVPVSVALEWSFFESERDALLAFRELCMDALWCSDLTSSKP